MDLFANSIRQFFLLQIGSLYVQQKYQLEYIDHRLFYIINIVCLIFILLALFLFVSFKNRGSFL